MSFFLGFLLLVSAVLRGFNLPVTPPELFGDEIDVGFQAVSLFKTGKDINNQPLPVYIHSLSEWRAPLLIYATVPTVALFGNTIPGVRLPEVVFGSIAPVLLYLLVIKLTGSKKLSAVSALFLAFSPWHIHYSRAGFEVVLLLDLVMAGTLLFIKKSRLWPVFFALSVYTYSTAVLFIPAWTILLHFIFRTRPKVSSLGVLTLLLVPFIISLFFGKAGERFGTLSLFSNPDVVASVLAFRGESALPGENLLHNRPETLFRYISASYLNAFSADFLFVRGDPTMRHSWQVIGQQLPLTAPLLLAGLAVALYRKKWFWISWLALAPIPAALTSDGGYHATRLFLLLPPISFLTGLGFVWILSLFTPRLSKIVAGIAILLIGGQFIWAYHYYQVHYPVRSWRWWQTGFRQVLSSPALFDPQYSRVFINNTYEPSLIRFLFYSSYSPEKFHRNFTLDQPQAGIVPNYDGFSLDGRFFFGTFTKEAHERLADFLMPNSLYVLSQRDDLPGNWDWRTSAPPGIKVHAVSTDPYDNPILYLVSKE